MNILHDAQETVRNRRYVYGHPFDDFSRIAQMWGWILNCIVEPQQVALCMIALKLSRECNSHKRDNLVDIAGYVQCFEDVESELRVIRTEGTE